MSSNTPKDIINIDLTKQSQPADNANQAVSPTSNSTSETPTTSATPVQPILENSADSAALAQLISAAEQATKSEQVTAPAVNPEPSTVASAPIVEEPVPEVKIEPMPTAEPTPSTPIAVDPLPAATTPTAAPITNETPQIVVQNSSSAASTVPSTATAMPEVPSSTPRRNNGPRIKALNPANAQPEDFLYNKSTIGGIDTSKLEYKETFKKKIYFNAPTHKYSWIILVILIVLFGAGALYYFPGLSLMLFAEAPQEVVINQPAPDTQKPTEELGLRDKLLQIKAPFLLENDDVITLYKKTGEMELDNPQINNIFTTESLLNISLEFYKIKSIVDSQNPAATTSSSSGTTEKQPAKPATKVANPTTETTAPVESTNSTQTPSSSTTTPPATQQ